jgi:hypothetical protein
MPKHIAETEGPQMTSQYGAYALHAGLARLHARMRMHNTTCLGNPHARTHALTHSHTDEYVILPFHCKNDSPARPNITLCVH